MMFFLDKCSENGYYGHLTFSTENRIQQHDSVLITKGFFAGIIYNSMKAIKKVAVTHAGDFYNFSKL